MAQVRNAGAVADWSADIKRRASGKDIRSRTRLPTQFAQISRPDENTGQTLQCTGDSVPAK